MTASAVTTDGLGATGSLRMRLVYLRNLLGTCMRDRGRGMKGLGRELRTVLCESRLTGGVAGRCVSSAWPDSELYGAPSLSGPTTLSSLDSVVELERLLEEASSVVILFLGLRLSSSEFSDSSPSSIPLNTRTSPQPSLNQPQYGTSRLSQTDQEDVEQEVSLVRLLVHFSRQSCVCKFYKSETRVWKIGIPSLHS